MQLSATWSRNAEIPAAVVVVGSNELFKCLFLAQPTARGVGVDDCKARLLFGIRGNQLAHAVLGKEVAPRGRPLNVLALQIANLLKVVDVWHTSNNTTP
jgi:hypothetical protein